MKRLGKLYNISPTMSLLTNSKSYKKCHHIKCYLQNECLLKVSLYTVT